VAVVTNDRVAALHGGRLGPALSSAAQRIEIRLPEG